MKVTIDLPDTTALMFLNLAYMKNGTMMLGSVSVDSKDLQRGYVDADARLGEL